MEAFFILLALAYLLAAPCALVLAIIAIRRLNTLKQEVLDLRQEVQVHAEHSAKTRKHTDSPAQPIPKPPSATQQQVAPADAVQAEDTRPVNSKETSQQNLHTGTRTPTPIPDEPGEPPLPPVAAAKDAVTESVPAMLAAANPSTQTVGQEVNIDDSLESAAVDPGATEDQAKGEDPAKQPQLDRLEELLGRRLLTWLGIAILFLAGAFLVHLAYEHGYLGRVFTPGMRLATLLAVAVVGYAWGWRCHRRGHLPLAQGLLGGSIGLTVLAIFAAYRPGVLFSAEATPLGPITAFMALAATSGWGFVLAVRLNASALAHMALLCGLATPILLSTGQGERDVLCAWLFILNAGALAAAAGRNWRGLPTVAVSGSALLLSLWVFTYGIHHPGTDWIALAWFAAFQLLALALPVVGSLLRRQAPPLRHLLLSASASAVLLSLAWALVAPATQPLAVLSLVFALLQALQVGLFLRSWPQARRIASAMVLLQANIAIALMLGAHALSLVWSAQALVLLTAGLHGQSTLLRRAALLLLGLASAVGIWHGLSTLIPRGSFPAAEGWWLSWSVLPMSWAVWALLQQRAVGLGNAFDRSLGQALGLLAGLGLSAAALAEVLRLRIHADPNWWSTWPVTLPAAWLLIIAAAALSAWHYWRKAPALYGWHQGRSGLLCACLGLFLCFVSYGHGARLGPIPLLNAQGLAVLLILLLAVLQLRYLRMPMALLPGVLALVAGFACELWLWAGHWGLDTSDRLWWLGLWWGLLALGARELSLRLRYHHLDAAALGLVAMAMAVWISWTIVSTVPQASSLFAGWWWLGMGLPAALAIASALRSMAHRTHSLDWATWRQPHTWQQASILITGLALTWVASAELLRLQNLATDPWWPHLQPGLLALVISCSAAMHMICFQCQHKRWRITDHTPAIGLAPDLGSQGWALAACAAILTTIAYGTGFAMSTLPLLHLHGMLALAVPALLAWAWLQRRLTPLIWIAFATAFLLTTLEAWTWPAGQEMDMRSSLLAITATWTLWASVLLGLGLRRNSRSLRLLGLSVMGLAVAKLLLLDLAGMDANQRILISLIVGIACLAAGAGYHRLSRR